MKALEKALGYSFKNSALLVTALTHPSARGTSNQRLEFLGDKVLGLIIADLLVSREGNDDEGVLTRQLTMLVRTETLAEIANEIGIGQFLIIGKGADQSILQNKGALADALEAVIAALFKDGGMGIARRFVEFRFLHRMPKIGNAPHDYKTELQEMMQGRKLRLPCYRVLREAGPAHQKEFIVEVILEGTGVDTCFRGTGLSIKAAEMRAAKAALDWLA